MQTRMQAAVDRMVSQLAPNPNVLTVVLFGSFVRGDVWEGSDVDLFIVLASSPTEVWGQLLIVQDVPIHAQFFRKPFFIKQAGGLIGRPFHAAIWDSRLLIDRDPEIAGRIAAIKADLDRDKNVRTVAELTGALEALYQSNKQHHFGRFADASVFLGEAWTHWARALLFFHGHLPGRAPLAQCRDLGLIAAAGSNRLMAPEVGLLGDEIAKGLPDMAVDLIDRIGRAAKPLSDAELEAAYEAIGADISPSRLLEMLALQGVLTRSERPYQFEGLPLGNEFVYARA